MKNSQRRDKESEAAKETESNTTTKRKRELSITPPPELPKYIYDAILAKSKDGKRSHPILLGDDHRDTNRQTVIDVLDLDDKAQDTGLDPELASIAAKVSSASAGPGATDQVHQIHSLAEQQQPVDQPKEVSVLLRHLRYQWECTHLHPVELARVTMDVKIAMNDSDPFKGMMQFYAMHKMMRPSDLVFTYKNMRLLPSATPRSLSMPSVVVLDIYTEAGYNCMKQHADEERARWLLERSQQEEKTPPPKTGASDGHDSNANIGQTTLDQQDEGDEESEFLFIKIRGKDTTDERMRVKKSTTVAAICSAYKKLKRIAETTVVKLEFDDSTLPPQTSMADTDIEDDDMLTATLL
ncbi:hypothetical protein DFQ26_003285 [Actinomortierella ambigua]|nr:hypothetical protein DFQ26_003285 [Actinomortierella ambigua]